MLDVLVQQILERKHLRLAVHQGEEGDAEGVLQLRVLVEKVQDDLRIGILLQFDDHADAVFVRLVTEVGDTGDGEKLVKLVKKHKPDVMLLDLVLHKQNAIEVLRQVSALNADVRSILLTDTIEKGDMLHALLCGARGVSLKEESTHLLYKSIRAVMAGEYWVSRNGIGDLVQNLQSLTLKAARNARIQVNNLSRQQQQIVEAIVSGYSNKEIAEELSVSERTVKYHITKIFNKFGVSGRMELVQQSLKNDLANTATQ